VTEPQSSVRRVLAGQVTDLPEGHVARATGPDDVAAITALMRSVEIAGCGHTSTNIEEVSDELADPGCGWEYGSAAVWRGADLVGAVLVSDGLVEGRGWFVDVYARPGDPRARAILGSLIDAALREGRYRWDALYLDPDVPLPIAKSGGYANDGALRAELEIRGFAEVRRYWRMKADHWSVEGLTGQGSHDADADPAVVPKLPGGYVLRPFRDVESEWRDVHAVSSLSFLDHFDFTPLDFEAWQARLRGVTVDPTQWIVAEFDGQMVGYVLGSNTYASDDCGYVASIGVLQEHRGKGVARALLSARMADDVERGFLSTILHVDATNPTGATALYESVGFVADSEFVGFHRPLFR
jgi:ribosomal protein S18 acetylase RimI-like enzyme